MSWGADGTAYTPTMTGSTAIDFRRTGLLAPRPPRVGAIIARAAKACDLTEDDLIGPRRLRPLVHCRALAVWTLRKLRPEQSYPQIGRFIGGRDHATIINLHRKAVVLIAISPEFADQCRDMLTHFRGGRS